MNAEDLLKGLEELGVDVIDNASVSNGFPPKADMSAALYPEDFYQNYDEAGEITEALREQLPEARPEINLKQSFNDAAAKPSAPSAAPVPDFTRTV